MIKYLQEENIDENLIKQLEAYRKENGPAEGDRVIKPEYKYYGKEVLEQAIAALLAGKTSSLLGLRLLGKMSFHQIFPIYFKDHPTTYPST